SISTFETLKLTAVFDAVALRQLQRSADSLLNSPNGTPQIAPGDIALHHDPPLDAFPHNKVRAAILLDVRDTSERDSRPGGRIHQHFANASQSVFTVSRTPRILVLGDQWKTDLAFEDPADLGSEQRRLDTIADFAGGQTVARDAQRIGPNIQCRD